VVPRQKTSKSPFDGIKDAYGSITPGMWQPLTYDLKSRDNAPKYDKGGDSSPKKTIFTLVEDYILEGDK